jgi:hypothetical protein
MTCDRARFQIFDDAHITHHHHHHGMHVMLNLAIVRESITYHHAQFRAADVAETATIMMLLSLSEVSLSLCFIVLALILSLSTSDAYSIKPRDSHKVERISGPGDNVKAPLGLHQATSHSTPFSRNADPLSRRNLFGFVPALVIAYSTAVMHPFEANGLDIDSFVQNELKADDNCNDRTSKKCKPNLTEYEALCRFGQPSTRTGEACLRAGMSTQRPSGVDAFGTVDRGNFVKCKPNYVEDPKNPGFLVNVWNCE